ncbi:hypothetical protein JTB14_019515 [Gonioctena quinquepunctata]|nr:hypothetical protein JTB14_019515 [Gonioctena quinquepunctata]
MSWINCYTEVKDMQQIHIAWMILQQKYDALVVSESEVYESLLAQDESEEDLELEIESSDVYRVRFTTMKLCFKKGGHDEEVRWWKGPKWLYAEPCLWPRELIECNEEEIEKEKKKLSVTTLLICLRLEFFTFFKIDKAVRTKHGISIWKKKDSRPVDC